MPLYPLDDSPTHAELGAGRRKDADFDLVEEGEVFEPVSVRIDADKLLSYAFAQGDYGSWYFGDSPFGGPIGHPLLLANDLLFLFYEHYDGNTARGLHTHEQLGFHAPVRFGETVTVSGVYSQKYVSRGRGYVVLEAEARGEDGRLLVTHRGTEIMRTVTSEVAGRSLGSPQGRRVEAVIDASLPVAERARPGIPPRSGVPGVSRHFTQDQMSTFSWLSHGYRNVHTDIERARESGVGRTIVQALQQTGLITQAMVAFFGESWFTSGRLDMRYTHPAFCREQLTVGAAVLGEADGRLELEVWVDADTGARTALGWASAAIGSDERRPAPLLPW